MMLEAAATAGSRHNRCLNTGLEGVLLCCQKTGEERADQGGGEGCVNMQHQKRGLSIWR